MLAAVAHTCNVACNGVPRQWMHRPSSWLLQHEFISSGQFYSTSYVKLSWKPRRVERRDLTAWLCVVSLGFNTGRVRAGARSHNMRKIDSLREGVFRSSLEVRSETNAFYFGKHPLTYRPDIHLWISKTFCQAACTQRAPEHAPSHHMCHSTWFMTLSQPSVNSLVSKLRRGFWFLTSL